MQAPFQAALRSQLAFGLLPIRGLVPVRATATGSDGQRPFGDLVVGRRHGFVGHVATIPDAVVKGIDKELGRIVKPFDAAVILAALDGAQTVFDVDAEWEPHHMGEPRTVPRGVDAFDGRALVAGLQALSFLAANLPVGDPRRVALPGLAERIRKRLANPKLLMFVSWNIENLKVDGDGLVIGGNYLYFRPAKITDREAKICVDRTTMNWPNMSYGWSGVAPAWRQLSAPGFLALVQRASETPLQPGQYETDPRASAPQLVEAAAERFELSESAATLYLQVLGLCDCSDVWLRQINGWTASVLKRAVAELADAELVVTEKKPRAGRAATLPGTWEKLWTPQPGIETWKLALYDAPLRKDAVLAPLGRILPLRPVHEIFADAWRAVEEGKLPGADRARTATSADWVARIAASPEDDELRRVYADQLMESADPRGELMMLQLQRHERARAGASDDEIEPLAKADAELVEKHQRQWLEPVEGWLEHVGWDRGTVTSIQIHADKFAKHADALFEAMPMLQEIRILSGRRNQIAGLVGSPAFAKIRRLDFTPDEYIRNLEDLELLLGGEHLGPLTYLRIGFHRPGMGFGAGGGKAIAGCDKLRELRFLEVAGQDLKLGGVEAIVQSEVLTKLEVLRVPYNWLRGGGVKRLAKRLEDGALPSLRVLDVGNVVETDFVTAAVQWQRNRVPPDVQRRVNAVLGARWGKQHWYTGDPVADESDAPDEVLPQTGEFPLVQPAKSGRSKCIMCKKAIKKGALRIGVQRKHEEIGTITAWLHAECRDGCPELANVADMDQRLARAE